MGINEFNTIAIADHLPDQSTVRVGNCNMNQTIANEGIRPSRPTIVGPSAVEIGKNGVIYLIPENPESIYRWKVLQGATIVKGQGTHEIMVNFGNGRVSGAVSVIETNTFGSMTTYLNVITGAAPIVSFISGPSSVIEGQTYSYSVPSNSDSSYNWKVPPRANIISGQGTSSIIVSFPPGTASGELILTETNRFGNGATALVIHNLSMRD